MKMSIFFLKKTQIITSLGEAAEISCLVYRMTQPLQISLVTGENLRPRFYKLQKIYHPGYAETRKQGDGRRVCARMFTASLVMPVTRRTQPKCSPTEERVNCGMYIQQNNYLALQRYSSVSYNMDET